MQMLAVLYIPLSSNNRKQIVLIHHSQYRFRAAMDSVSLWPDMYSAVAAGAAAWRLTLSYLLSQWQILFWNIHMLNISAVSAAGHFREPTHLADTVLLPVTIDNFIFDAGFHSFPASERKSRSSFTSIFNLLFSYLYSWSVLACLRLGAQELPV